MNRLGDRVVGWTAAIGIVLGSLFVAWESGAAYGRGKANLDLWSTPPGMASCIVYQDGGKRCQPAATPAPVDLVECARMCRARVRMDKVKEK
jgi:hypothetical protein